MAVKQKWIPDASNMEVGNIASLIYINKGIDKFFHEQGWMFLCANKGMGKTLILTYKRLLLSEQNPSAVFIPSNNPYLDHMGYISNLSKQTGDFLAEKGLCVRFWIFCLKLSVLTYVKVKLHEEEIHILSKLPEGYFGLISDSGRTDHRNPSKIFSQMLSKSPGEIAKMVNHITPVLDIVFARVKSEVHIFIDKVDQALRGISATAWINIQGALMEASWLVHTDNNHVNLHCTIRQEAYTNYRSEIKANISTAAMRLKYEDHELMAILNSLAKYYEQKTIQELLGRKDFYNGLGRQQEDAFHFILRNTLSRPRDLVSIARGISDQDQNMTDDVFTEKVATACNIDVVPNVLDEVGVFLECLGKDENRAPFFALIPHNILTHDEIGEIFCIVNKLPPNTTIEASGLSDDQVFHPFTELYKAGLLGIINESNIQTFMQPYDLYDHDTTRLPSSPYYIIHPALRSYIFSKNRKASYNIYRYIIPGHNCRWDEEFNEKVIYIQNRLFKINHRELSTTVFKYLDKHIDPIRSGIALQKDKEFDAMESLFDTLLNQTNMKDDSRQYLFELYYKLGGLLETMKTAEQS